MPTGLKFFSVALTLGLVAQVFAGTPALAASSPTITYSAGNSSSWVMTDFGINDVSTASTVAGPRTDAYDGAMALSICSDANCSYASGSYTPYSAIGTFDSNLNTYNGTSTVINGLTVSAKIRLSASTAAGRMLSTFQNTSSGSISRVIRIYSNLGSDGSTSLKYTSSNQTLSNQALPNMGDSNYWSITAQDTGLTGSAQAANDPINSYVWGTPDAAVRGSANIANGEITWIYTLNIPANTTQSILFVFGLGEVSTTSNTFAGALSGVKTYLDSYTKLPSDLLSDLTSSEVASIQNWMIAPSPTTFSSTQSTPTNTLNAFNYTLNMTQSITGLESGDFGNSGTATGCTFTPNASSGTSFTITASSCGEGTVRPQLLANSVTGTQSGPAANSPASTTVVIDRTAPIISTVTTTNGNYQATSNANLNFTVGFSESVTVTGTPRIPITIGSTTRYANFLSLTDSRTATFRFTVSVNYDDIDLNGIAVNSPLELNSGTIADLATNAIASLTFTPPVTTSVNVYQPPSAPTLDSITANNGSVTVYFTAGASNGSTVSNYKYSLNSGAYIALSPTDPTSPITITGLTNGTNYQIAIRAVSNLGDGLASNSVASTPSASASVTIALTASATTATKGTTIVITATVSQAGLVNFSWNGKRIAGCIKRVATSSATCNWKPSVTGTWSISALLDPTDPSYVNSTSSPLSVLITKRSNSR